MSAYETQPKLKDLVKRARAQAGMTQMDLADAIQMSQRWVSDMERGIIKTPRNDTMRRMADALKLDIADIVIAAQRATTRSGAERVIAEDFGITVEMYESDPVVEEVSSRMRQLSEEGKRAMLLHLRAVESLDARRGPVQSVREVVERIWPELSPEDQGELEEKVRHYVNQSADEAQSM